jgi:hypothetical protein
MITKNTQYRECIICLLGQSVSELAVLFSSLIENMPSVGKYALRTVCVLALHFVNMGRVQVGHCYAVNAKLKVM